MNGLIRFSLKNWHAVTVMVLTIMVIGVLMLPSIPLEIHLSHFLNDGDSPDIPIPTYIDYLNQIRLEAIAKQKSAM